MLVLFQITYPVHQHNGQSVFELSNVEHHDHLVCVKCGKIDEFTDEVIEINFNYIFISTFKCLFFFRLHTQCTNTVIDKTL
jgi:Fur family ferric uptake transcriptional regulator